MTSLLEIVFEETSWLGVNKPADLVCHPTKEGPTSSLIGRLRLHLGSDGTPVMVNRLDRETSGLVLVAKDREAARELGRIWEARAVHKTYLAVVHGHVTDEEGLVDAPLGRDQASRVAIKNTVRADGSPAQTAFRVVRRFMRPEGAFTLLEVQPRTGRKHQIRIHFAHLGHPVVGDKLYGGDEDLYLALVERRLTEEQRRRLILRNHALHAWRLEFRWRDLNRVLTAPPPPELEGFCSDALRLKDRSKGCSQSS